MGRIQNHEDAKLRRLFEVKVGAKQTVASVSTKTKTPKKSNNNKNLDNR